MKENDRLNSNSIPFLNCQDYLVSNEVFSLLKNEAYELLLTEPVPENLENYYQSEAYISHTDSKRTLLEKVYQQVRKYTIQKKNSLINSFQTEEKLLLDIGAGTGDFLAQSKKCGWTVLGTEPNVEARKIASEKGIELVDDFFKIDKQQFDVVTLWHVLEHIPNLEEAIAKLKSLVKPSGVLVIAVPNFKSFDAAYYNQFWAAYDVPRHLWHFSQKAIEKLFSEVGFELIKTKPMKFDSYYVSLLSEKNKTGKMNPIKAFYIGFLSNLKARRTSEYSSLIYVLKNAK